MERYARRKFKSQSAREGVNCNDEYTYHHKEGTYEGTGAQEKTFAATPTIHF